MSKPLRFCYLFLGLVPLINKEKMTKMIFWVVRHAEREDNINSAWQRTLNLQADNSPLSKRGRSKSYLLFTIFVY